MENSKEHLGVAAIAVFESLMLSLKERQVISGKEADNILIDAIAALEGERALHEKAPIYGLAVDVIRKIQSGANGVREGES